MIYGKTYYYKNYQEVVNQGKTLETVKDSSRLQSIFLSIPAAYFTNLFEENY